MKKKLWMLTGGAILGLLAALAGGLLSAKAGWSTMNDPLLSVGRGLRVLSLSGFGGDLLAWLVVLLVSGAPLLLLIRIGKKGRGMEDLLLGLMAPVIFCWLFYLANPTQLGETAAQIFPLAGGCTVLSMGAAWLVLKLLRGLDGAPTQRLAAAFGALLSGCALLCAFSVAYGGAAGVAAQWAWVVEGNTNPGGLTLPVLIVLGVLNAAPGLLVAVTMVWGSELASVLGGGTFDQAGAELCGRVALACKTAAQATVTLTVFANLLQLALVGELLSASFSITLPLFSLAASAGLFLLCRCLQRGAVLQEDNDSII
ncbi:hypothetical protein [Muriventricola aceti]|uniref:hypothetical protein n=1 Tax=Muriventricola aceti TaxID=2981773 RepID=UPI000821077F|nr:hypothetical protein [Muriventricola aceti]MCU6702958.1 hypothetical protein [Muriventricola aceti]SCJ27990.1 Uncharacterised protein [uncultured Flavonifractor sp.]